MTTAQGVQTVVSTFNYDNNDNLIEFLDAENNSTKFEYDANDNQTAIIDSLGRRTEFRYDEKNNLIETIYPDDTPEDLSDNLRLKSEYDANGNQISVTTRSGRTSLVQYDARNKPFEVIYDDQTPEDLTDNFRNSIDFNQLGQANSIVDQTQSRVEYEYDQLGRLEIVRNGIGNEMTNTYDAIGRTISVTDPLQRTTEVIYDRNGRVIEAIFADGTSIKTEYDAFGNEIAKTDQGGITTRYEYDALDQLTAVIDANGNRTEYQYDEAGNLVFQKDANDNITRWEYDILGRQTATIRPLGQRDETIYNSVGNVIKTIDFNGEIIEYSYDELNRLVSKYFVDENYTVEVSYTAENRWETVTDERGTTYYNYNEFGFLESRVEPDGVTISYTYNDKTQLESITTPSGTTTYTYDELNNLDQVIRNGEVTDYDYDAVGNLIQTILPNGITETRNYDQRYRLTSVTNTDGDGNIVSSYLYELDEVGHILSVEELNGRIVEYDYDDVYRLTEERIIDPIEGERTISYTYDDVGNRLTRNDSVDGLTVYTYNQNDWLLSETKDELITNYIYNSNGNVVSKVNSEEQVIYNWDGENSLIEVDIINSQGNSNIEYKYSVNGLRVASIVDGVETRYLLDGNSSTAQVLEEYQPDGTINVAYIYGTSLISQSRDDVNSIYLYDGHSGVRQLSDDNGIVTDIYDYDAYGNLISSSGETENIYLYRGEQLDQNLGMQYLRARYYDPNSGRFSSVDPYEGNIGQPMSRHRYMYGNANPITYVDPTGLFSDTYAVPTYQNALLSSYVQQIPNIGNTIRFGSYLSKALGGIGAGAIVISKTLSQFKNNPWNKWEGLRISGGLSNLAIPELDIPRLDGAKTQKFYVTAPEKYPNLVNAHYIIPSDIFPHLPRLGVSIKFGESITVV
ncbi:RHS repeat-associated core domain-containing protein [Cyanobacterium aponinum]|uniref:RHS repeat-associated core domain-containing protein n=1 Tax=Cyanobacterium aponinum TaxID=379064 RepID=UPI003977F23B